MFLILATMFISVVVSKDNRPNIIFMMADQQRQDSIGAYPGSVAITPNLDSIAADGLLLTNSWTSTPSCTPARSAILTGKSPWGHGMLGYGAVAMNYPYELVHPLNDAGYITASIGKNHFGFLNGTYWSPVVHGYQSFKLYDGLGNGMPVDPEAPTSAPSNCNGDSYDDYDQYFQTVYPGQNPEATGGTKMNWNSWRGAPFIYNTSIHPTAWVAEQAMDFLDQYNGSKPFFLKISFHRPHSPYDPPREIIDFVKENYDLNTITNILHGNYWDSRFTQTQWCGDTFTSAWCGWMSMNDTNNSRIDYFANVKFIDDKLGDILNKLRSLNLYNNTYILWTADHGDQLGDHNLWRKTYPYNSNAKIPMIIKWPTADAGTTFNVKDIKVNRGTINKENIVELRDLLPTLHNVSDIGLPSNWSTDWSGLNMNCILYGNCNWRAWLDLEHTTCYNETNHWNALTDGTTYKYIFNAFFANESLFNLQNDPNEMNDLAPLAVNDSSINTTLTMWRERMINMFEKQNRGPVWVQNNTLMQRTKAQTYGPNYPGHPAPCQ